MYVCSNWNFMNLCIDKWNLKDIILLEEDYLCCVDMWGDKGKNTRKYRCMFRTFIDNKKNDEKENF